MSAATVVAELTEVDALPSAKVEPSIGDGNVDAHTGNYISSNISFKSFRFFSACGQSGAIWPIGTIATAS